MADETKPRAAKKKKYTVFKANIMDDDGNKCMAGSVVSLSTGLAKHYNSLGFLRPYMEDDEDEDDESSENDTGGKAGVGGEAPKPAGPARDAAVAKTAPVQSGAATK